jgi:hypothetical protein
MSDSKKQIPYKFFHFDKHESKNSQLLNQLKSAKSVSSVKRAKSAKSVKSAKRFSRPSISRVKKKVTSSTSMPTTALYPRGYAKLFNDNIRIKQHLSKNLPKNPIILITTHGEICMGDKSQGKTVEFFIPTSFSSIQKINFAPQGYVSLMSALSSEEVGAHLHSSSMDSLGMTHKKTHLFAYSETIKRQINKAKEEYGVNIDDTDDKTFIDSFSENLKNLLELKYNARNLGTSNKEVLSTLSSAVSLHKFENSDQTVDHNKRNKIFVHQKNKKNQLVMRNKTFITGDNETERSAHHHNFSINILNMKNNKPFDLLPGILMSHNKRQRGSSLEITTEELLEYLSSIVDDNGNSIIKHLILVDTSCSVYDDDYNVTFEGARHIASTGFGGTHNKTKKIKKYNTNNK